MTKRADKVSRNRTRRFPTVQSPLFAPICAELCGAAGIDSEGEGQLPHPLSQSTRKKGWGTLYLDGARSFRARRIITFAARFQFAPFIAEARQVRQADSLQSELKSSRQHSETVLHAAAEVDGRRFLEIFRRAGNFSDTEAEVNTLRQHLVIEN